MTRVVSRRRAIGRGHLALVGPRSPSPRRKAPAVDSLLDSFNRAESTVLTLERHIPGLGQAGDRIILRPGHPTHAAVLLHPIAPNFGEYAGLLADGLLSVFSCRQEGSHVGA